MLDVRDRSGLVSSPEAGRVRVDTRPRRRNAPRPAEKSAPGFLQWLRGRDCVFAYDGECAGKLEAMHLDFAGDKGMSTKVSDRFAVPGCSEHHRCQHLVGWDTFLRQMGHTKDGLLYAAGRYWQAWPGRIAWERKQAENA
jgi:hypothetical protein